MFAVAKNSELLRVLPPLSEGSIGAVDLLLLLATWILIFICSIKSLSIWGVIIFIIFNILLVFRNSNNGLLVLILIFYTPAVVVGIPNIFTFSALILCIKHGILDMKMLNKDIRSRLAIFYPIFIFITYITVSILLSPNIDLAMPFYVKYLEGAFVVFLFASLVDSREKLVIFLKWWGFVAAIGIILKLVHVYLGANTNLYQLMQDTVRNDFTLEERLSINVDGLLSKRLLLPGEEPNYASAGLIFPFAISLAFYRVVKNWRRYFWLMMSLLIWTSVAGTFSRSGFLASIFVVSIFFIVERNRAAIPPVVGVLLLIAGITVYFPELAGRISGINTEIYQSGSGRYDLWSRAYENWIEAPILGNGLAYFYDEFGDAAHNTYIQILVECGIVGVGLFISIIIASLLQIIRMPKQLASSSAEDLSFSRTIMAGIIGVSVIIGTVTYQDIKLFWLAIAAAAAIKIVSVNDFKVVRSAPW